MSLGFELVRGGDAVLLQGDGVGATLSSSISSPPGSTLEARAAGFERAFELKVKQCKKQPDGRFAITGKWVNLTREQRAYVISPGQ